MADETERELARVGLCARCVNAHIVETRRGSRFYRCLHHEVDPAYPRYPALPVIACGAYKLVPIDLSPLNK
jgi:uncharacterized membrane protein YkvA (DUF1232 family)